MNRRSRRPSQRYVKHQQAGYLLSGIAVLVVVGFVVFVARPWQSAEERKQEGVNRILAKVNATSEQVEEPENPDEMRLIPLNFTLFGSEGFIKIASSKLLATNRREVELVGKLRELQAMLDRSDPQSELAKLEQQAGATPLEVSDAFFEVLQACKQAYRVSEGGVDCTLGPVRDFWSFDPQKRRIALRAELEQGLTLVGDEKLVLDAAAKTALLQQAGMKLDVSMIAHALAFRLADAFLSEAGYKDFLMFLGNDAYVRGDRGGTGWQIKLYHPRRAWKGFASLKPALRTMSVTGDYEHMFETKRRRIHPTLDPRTGQPTQTLQQITVQADDPVLAQAFGVGAFVHGAEWAFQQVEKHPGLEFVLHDKQGTMRMSEGMKTMLILEGEKNTRQMEPSQAPVEEAGQNPEATPTEDASSKQTETP